MTRAGWLLSTAVPVLIVGIRAFVPPTPRLLWNATASTPVGLYALRPVHGLKVGDLVAALPPEPVARFLADGGYLPRGVPLLKHVAALARQTVCRSGAVITIDGTVAGAARERDSRGRALPSWRGCRALVSGDVFLMNSHPDSLDGRYFGPLPMVSVLGRATPLFLLPTHSGGPS